MLRIVFVAKLADLNHQGPNAPLGGEWPDVLYSEGPVLESDLRRIIEDRIRKSAFLCPTWVQRIAILGIETITAAPEPAKAPDAGDRGEAIPPHLQSAPGI